MSKIFALFQPKKHKKERRRKRSGHEDELELLEKKKVALEKALREDSMSDEGRLILFAFYCNLLMSLFVKFLKLGVGICPRPVMRCWSVHQLILSTRKYPSHRLDVL